MTLPVKVLRDLRISPSADDGRPYLAAGSGVACIKDLIYVAADDELSVGVFPRHSANPGRLFPLFDGVLSSDPKQRKKEKPDLESMCVLPDNAGILMLPSGSKRNRVRGALAALDVNGEIQETHEVDFSELYAELKPHIKGLNIEGATVFGDQVLLFQRGNSSDKDNAIVSLDFAKFVKSLFAHRQIDPSCIVTVTHCPLHMLMHVPLSFTDACALDDQYIVFTATAEDTTNPYDDGKTVGSVIGILDHNFQVMSQHTINFPDKVEGVWIVTKSGLKNWDGEVLLVTDADDRSVPAKLLSARVPK